jgi:hypothetical protein
VTEGPGSLFKGFEAPQSGAITKSDEEVLPVPMVEEMRVWLMSGSQRSVVCLLR